MSEKLNIGDVTKLVEMYLTICTNMITECGGEVIKFLGDAAMANFPFDGADRAIKAGVEIIAEIESFRNIVSKTSPLSVLFAGVGISHGKVTEGNIGSDIKMDYTILGDTVNIASRLESLIRHLKVPLCLSGDVKARARDPWVFKHLGKQSIRGRNTPIEIYSVREPRIGTSFIGEKQILQKIHRFLKTYNKTD